MFAAGTSGWSYPQWRRTLYQGCQQGRWLERYAEQFPAVEYNGGFYRLPTEANIRKWVDMVPGHFRFAAKAHRSITHNARLKNCEKELSECLALLRGFGEKLGPVLFQLPPGLQRDDALLADFLSLLPRGLSFACEFRNPSWQHERVFALLEQAGVALCDAHMREWLGPRVMTSNLYYARLHGSKGWFKGAYSERFLEQFADFIGSARHIEQAYVFFNNTMEDDDAPHNAAALNALLLETAA